MRGEKKEQGTGENEARVGIRVIAITEKRKEENG